MIAATGAIARREVQASWLSPVGYLVTALFLLVTSGVYFGLAPLLLGSGFAPGQPTSLRLFFQIAMWAFFVICPAISMRAIAEEVRSGTAEILMTSPVTERSIVVGKFLGAMAFLVFMLAPTLLFVVALETHGRPDYGEVICGYLGLLLVGGTVIASGLLASTVTSSQVLAYLLTVFAWFILLLVTIGLPVVAGAAATLSAGSDSGSFAAFCFDAMQIVSRFLAVANPAQRLSGFVIGLVDTFDIVFFALFTAVFLAAATRGLAMRRWPSSSHGRRMQILSSTTALLSLLVIAASLCSFAVRPGLRMRFDATKTRAYSLSAQTVALLDELEGKWTIAVVLVENDTPPAIRRQANEVLRRFEQQSDAIDVAFIDPTDPASLPAYERLLDRLRSAEAERITAYDTALDRAEGAFRELQLFAGQQSAQLEQLLQRLPAADRDGQMVRRVQLLGLLARDGGQVLDAVATNRRITDVQPIPDYDSARSTLAQALTQWSNELSVVGDQLDEWSLRTDLDAPIRAFANAASADWLQQADTLAGAADPLLRLEPLELSIAGRALQSGEVALVLSDAGAAVVPQPQLFPQLPMDTADGAVAFDRRFRGEQVLAAAIRSLLEPSPPLVVFVHGEANSLFRPTESRTDLVGVRQLLETSRIEVREWRMQGGQRPVARDDQPVVYVVVPPLARSGLEPTLAEGELLETTQQLIAGGAPVLLSVLPSQLPRYGRPDPWSRIATELGVRFETEHVLIEAVPAGGDAFALQPSQTIRDFTDDHAIGRALDGQATAMLFPVPVRPLETIDPRVTHSVLASVPSNPRRWLESNWQPSAVMVEEIPDFTPLDEATPIALAIERSFDDGARQRVIAIGSGAWMLTQIADAVASIGGDRLALLNPGNPELMLASVAWLAERDERIAPSPMQQQVARLDDLGGGAATRWALVMILVLPGAVLLVGGGVWWRRRA